MFKLLFQLRIKNFFRYFKRNRTARLTTMCLFLVVYGFLFFGIYKFFQEGFIYISYEKYFKDALTLYLIEMTFLLVSFLVFFSSLITAIFSIFRVKENSLIIGSPKYRSLINVVYGRLIFSSIWPVLVIVIPAFLALNNVFGTKMISLSKSLVLVLMLLIFLSGAALILVLSIAWLLSKINIKELGNALKMKTMFFCIIMFLLLLGVFSWNTAIDKDLIHLFRATNLEQEILDPLIIERQFSYFPSNFAALGVFYNIENNLNKSNPCLLVLCFMVFVILILNKLFGYLLLPIWQKLSEGNFTAEPEAMVHGKKRRKAVKFSGNQTTAIFKKEALSAKRNTKGLFWFVFLTMIWIAQTGMNIVLGKNIAEYGLGQNGFPAVAEALQFATTLFFISAFVLRFAFPSFSSERKTAWIIYSAPVNFANIFLAKFLFYFSVFSLLGIAVGYLNLSILGLSLSALGISVLVFIGAIFFTTAYGMFLGARFPSFETDDPAILSTTLPGLAYMLGALIFSGLGAWLIFQMIINNSIIAVLVYTLSSLICGALFILLSLRGRRNIDYLTIS